MVCSYRDKRKLSNVSGAFQQYNYPENTVVKRHLTIGLERNLKAPGNIQTIFTKKILLKK
jgi:hypothetical protein